METLPSLLRVARHLPTTNTSAASDSTALGGLNIFEDYRRVAGSSDISRKVEASRSRPGPKPGVPRVPQRARSAIATPVIHIAAAPWYHYVGDLAAWIAAFLGARWVYRRRRTSVEGLARQTAPGYFISLALGGATGA